MHCPLLQLINMNVMFRFSLLEPENVISQHCVAFLAGQGGETSMGDDPGGQTITSLAQSRGGLGLQPASVNKSGWSL